MKIKDCIVFAECLRNPDPPLIVDDRTVYGESSICAHRQSGELFSKDEDSLQTRVTLSQLDLSKFPDGTRILQVGPPLIIDIPDSYIDAVRNSQSGTDKVLNVTVFNFHL